MRKGATVIADRGYDANHLCDRLRKAEAKPFIPPRRNRKIHFEYDTELYKTGNIGERMFNRIEYWRRLSLRTVRRPKTFLPAAHIPATVIRFL